MHRGVGLWISYPNPPFFLTGNTPTSRTTMFYPSIVLYDLREAIDKELKYYWKPDGY